MHARGRSSQTRRCGMPPAAASNASSGSSSSTWTMRARIGAGCSLAGRNIQPSTAMPENGAVALRIDEDDGAAIWCVASIASRTSTPRSVRVFTDQAAMLVRPERSDVPERRPIAAQAATTVAVWPPHRNRRSLTRTLPPGTTALTASGSCSTSSTEFVPTPDISIGRSELEDERLRRSIDRIGANLPIGSRRTISHIAYACARRLDLLVHIGVRKSELLAVLGRAQKDERMVELAADLLRKQAGSSQRFERAEGGCRAKRGVLRPVRELECLRQRLNLVGGTTALVAGIWHRFRRAVTVYKRLTRRHESRAQLCVARDRTRACQREPFAQVLSVCVALGVFVERAGSQRSV